ncbi:MULTISPECIES: hypothetical protein [Streptomyces]|uniref:Uncharacterized protein n=1 Tax=Streptomyces flavovirens TaxID=52258 RepID=A0ABV8NEL9_9ACTN|nr:hypothetical protein [Streptomyces sp. MBT51]MBK3596278.1 hypothetical protein [Streptomyces sp. MBT51]
MTTKTPAAELRAAVVRLRDVAPQITGPLAGLADPVAEWLEWQAEALTDGRIAVPAPALTVARRILGTTEQACPECGTSGACNGGPCPLGTTEQADTEQPDPVGLCADCGVPREAHHHAYVRTPGFAEAQQPTPAPAEETKPEGPVPPGGFTTRVCRNCSRSITWTATGAWTHEPHSRDGGHVATPYPLPAECHPAPAEETK